ncbi:hypothetical protein LCGC14_1625810 [marine sediment metagenome]|uniref:Uncharacterized protein n=1 Tax=marine sediment metagenome TaxID=412755 RepID=A0A0F9IR32_9ZZZZ
MTLKARKRDTHLLTFARARASVVGGSSLRSGGEGPGYMFRPDGGKIILSGEIGVQRLTMHARKRDTSLTAEQIVG